MTDIKTITAAKLIANNPGGYTEHSIHVAKAYLVMVRRLESVRDVLADSDINCLGSNSDGEIEWPLRDELIDGITKIIQGSKDSE